MGDAAYLCAPCEAALAHARAIGVSPARLQLVDRGWPAEVQDLAMVDLLRRAARSEPAASDDGCAAARLISGGHRHVRAIASRSLPAAGAFAIAVPRRFIEPVCRHRCERGGRDETEHPHDEADRHGARIGREGDRPQQPAAAHEQPCQRTGDHGRDDVARASTRPGARRRSRGAVKMRVASHIEGQPLAPILTGERKHRYRVKSQPVEAIVHAQRHDGCRRRPHSPVGLHRADSAAARFAARIAPAFNGHGGRSATRAADRKKLPRAHFCWTIPL